jgi:hypothetical protein
LRRRRTAESSSCGRTAVDRSFGAVSDDRNSRATTRANGIEQTIHTARITNNVVIWSSGELRAGGPVPSHLPISFTHFGGA